MNEKQIRAYFNKWRRTKSKKYQVAVKTAAEKIAVEMFIDLVKELEAARKRL